MGLHLGRGLNSLSCKSQSVLLMGLVTASAALTKAAWRPSFSLFLGISLLETALAETELCDVTNQVLRSRSSPELGLNSLQIGTVIPTLSLAPLFYKALVLALAA